MSSIVFRRFVNGSLSLAFLIPAWQLTRHLFLVAHHNGLQPMQHEAA
jgi:hypothetical protein